MNFPTGRLVDGVLIAVVMHLDSLEMVRLVPMPDGRVQSLTLASPAFALS